MVFRLPQTETAREVEPSQGHKSMKGSLPGLHISLGKCIFHSRTAQSLLVANAEGQSTFAMQSSFSLSQASFRSSRKKGKGGPEAPGFKANIAVEPQFQKGPNE